jgi:hypothetical protein
MWPFTPFPNPWGRFCSYQLALFEGFHDQSKSSWWFQLFPNISLIGPFGLAAATSCIPNQDVQ